MRHHTPKPSPPRRNKLPAALTAWLNHTIYPHLTHVQIFGQLPGYTDRDGDFYADCPVCHRHGVFYGVKGQYVGKCQSCTRIIGWFGYLRYQLDGHEEEAMRWIAQLAGVDTGPDGQLLPHGISWDTVGEDGFMGLFTLPVDYTDPLPS